MIESPELRDKLARNRFFRDLDPATLERLEEGHFELRTLPAGHVLAHQGDPAKEMYLILEGRISVSSDLSDGSQAILVERVAGDFVGEMGLIEDSRRSANLVCATECQVAAVVRAAFLRLLSLFPGLGTQLARAVSQRLREATHQRAVQVDVHAKLLELNRTIAEQNAALEEKNAALEKLNAELLRKNEELYRSATIDALTQVSNRPTILDVLGRELRRTQRYGTMVACVILDVDHFKALNDRYGHLAGDMVLRETAQVIRREVRDLDSVGRYGGEEFLVVLPQTGSLQGLAAAERIRRAVEAAVHTYESQELRVTISLGVAASEEPPVADVEELLRNADAALYLAKQQGRNRARRHP